MRTALLALAVLQTVTAEDWLLTSTPAPARLETRGPDVSLSNGLIRRTWRVKPDCATVAFSNLSTGASIIRGVKPEARLTLDGVETPVGGLLGQPDYAYLRPDWIDSLTPDPRALHCTGFSPAPVTAPFEWKRSRYASSTQWPPKGAGVVFHFIAQSGLKVDVHYEMYDGLPAIAKWFVIHNSTPAAVRLNRFSSEILAVVEDDSAVDAATPPPASLHVESDYSFHGMDARTANRTTVWLPDPDYKTQVNYERISPLLLESRPPAGPNALIAAGARFTSFRTFVLAFDSTDRERRGLAQRRLYRAIAPWATENPIMMHVRQSDDQTVRAAIDQSAQVGFEMVILSFGSGFNAEDPSPDNLARLRALNAYARSKGVELGGYSLLASRRIDDANDAINPKTGKPGNAIFGNSPCLASRWGLDYFAKLRNLFDATGMTLLEHDGSYPGDLCASSSHPAHEGLDDSQWKQWTLIGDFYRWARARGIYLNVPDWYYLSGSNKTGMGYRETNWSLPRDRQFILARQNVYDGTWTKTPSMGWMFVPLTEYHGGGAEATLEPLKDHLNAYEQHLVQNFGAGVQACYRGPRLFDAPETKAMLAKWVAFYKAHREILDSDVIHLRRPDGADWDGLLHVNPRGIKHGMAFLFNPLSSPITRRVTLPLYYAGLTGSARISINGAPPRRHPLDARSNATLDLTIPARGWTWLLIE